MLKIENTEVLGWGHAIRGMRNPMNSWEKSDSEWVFYDANPHSLDISTLESKYQVGPNGLCRPDWPSVLVEGVRYLQGWDGGQFLLHDAQNCGEGVHTGGFLV